MGSILLGIYFFGYDEKCQGQAPLSYTFWSTLPGLFTDNISVRGNKTRKALCIVRSNEVYHVGGEFVFARIENRPFGGYFTSL